MSKNYEVLNELVPKTQELHRAIFDKGYEQGRLQVIDEIRAEIADLADADAYGDYQMGFNFGLMRASQILKKHKVENDEKSGPGEILKECAMELMTLDEHIKKAEEDAAQAESDSDWGLGKYFLDPTEAQEYAENCRQLAKWLKDYKRLLERESCEDAISRKEVIDTIYHECSGERLDIDFGKVLLLQRKIKALPSVKPASCIAQTRFDEEKLKEIVKDGLRTVFDTESYASEDGGDLIRYEDAVGMVEELDFIQPKKTAGKLISIEVLDKIRAEIMELQTYKMFEGENTVYNERDEVLKIIDKYKAESDGV